MKPHRGPTILVLGILGLIMYPPVAIVAWFMGANDLENAGIFLFQPPR